MDQPWDDSCKFNRVFLKHCPHWFLVFVFNLWTQTKPEFFVLLSSNKDQIVMVNGTSMENIHSNFTIQILKSCGKTANVVSTETKLSDRNLWCLYVCVWSNRGFYHCFPPDCEASPKDPDPSHHQTVSSCLPLQPAGPRPSETGTSILWRQWHQKHKSLQSTQRVARTQRARKHSTSDVIRLQEASTAGCGRQTNQDYSGEEKNHRW